MKKENKIEINDFINCQDKDFLKNISNAIEQNKLVLFTGAGLSRLCGVCSWQDLARNLLNECENKGLLNYFKKSRIQSELGSDPREQISLAYYLMEKDKAHPDLFLNSLKKSLEYSNKKEQQHILDLIKTIGSKVITTNADNTLDDGYSSYNIHYKYDDITNIYFKGDEKELFHIHGSAFFNDSSKEDLIFTSEAYLNRYNTKKSKFRKNMKSILNNKDYTFLFIGYGLSEFQLLDFLMDNKSNNKKLYCLKGYFKMDKDLYLEERPYFDAYGVKLISFDLDDKGYYKLLDVLEYLKKEAEKIKYESTLKLTSSISLISLKPDSDSFKEIKNFIINTSDKNISNLFINLKTSSFLKEWIEILLNDEDVLKIVFKKKKINKKCYLTKDENLISILNVIFEIATNQELDKSIKELIDKKCLEYIEYEIKIKDSFFTVAFDYLFSNKDLLNNKETIKLLTKLVSNENYKNEYLGVFEKFKKHNSFSLIDDKYINDYIKLIILTDINLEEFTTKNRFIINNKEMLSSKINKENIDFLINKIIELGKDSILFNLSIDNLININNAELYKLSDLINLLITSLNKLDKEEFKKYYYSFISSEEEILINLGIYLTNRYFKELFNDLINNIKDKDLNNGYFDLYYLIKENKDDVNINSLLSLFDNLKFENSYKDLTKAKFYYLIINLFTNENELKTKKIEIEEYLVKHKVPYNKLNIKNIFSYEIDFDENKYYKEIEHKSLNSLIKEFVNNKYNKKGAYIRENIKEIFIKYNLKNKCLTNIKILKLDQDFSFIILQYIFKNEEFDINYLFKLFNIIVKENDKHLIYLYSYFYHYKERTIIFNDNQKQTIFDLLFSYVKENELLNENNNDEYNGNRNYYICFLLFNVTTKTNIDKLIDLLKENINSYLTKKLISIFMMDLYYLNPSFIKDNIKSIFNDNYEGYESNINDFLNYNAKRYNEEFIYLLNDNNLLNKIVNANNYFAADYKVVSIRILMNNYLINKEKIKELIFEEEDISYIIRRILSPQYIAHYNKDIVLDILNLIRDKKFDNHSYFIKYLFKAIENRIEIKKELLDLINNIIDNNSFTPYYYKDLYDYFSNDTLLTNEEKINIIVKISKSFNRHSSYYCNDFINLIECVKLNESEIKEIITNISVNDEYIANKIKVAIDNINKS